MPRVDLGEAVYYVMNQKSTGRKAAIIFETKLLMSFLYDFATIKTIEGWCKTYNYTHELIGTESALGVDKFRLHVERWLAMREVMRTQRAMCSMRRLLH